MAFTLQKTTGGDILKLTGGSIQGACCCGGGGCGNTGCFTVTGAANLTATTCPSMKLRVTGTTGTISWCGETWNLPGDSGLCKEVCPEYYRRGKRSSTATWYTTYYTSFRKYKHHYEKWRFGAYISDANGLWLQRGIDNEVFISAFGGSNCVVNFGFQTLAVKGASYSYGWVGNADAAGWSGPPCVPTSYSYGSICPATCAPPTNIGSTINNLGVLGTASPGPPTLNDYNIDSNWFSPCPCTKTPSSACTNSGVTISGVTYHWEKGSNWP